VTRVNVHEAKTRLSHYLDRVEAGETIILCRHNRPVAEVRPIKSKARRKRVSGVSPKFFEPLPIAKRKALPEFRSEDEEREFWAAHDSTEFIDWRSARRQKLPALKPTLRTISLRLPVSMIEDLKILANKRDVPYQSLLKVFLAERLRKELRRAS